MIYNRKMFIRLATGLSWFHDFDLTDHILRGQFMFLVYLFKPKGSATENNPQRNALVTSIEGGKQCDQKKIAKCL